MALRGSPVARLGLCLQGAQETRAELLQEHGHASPFCAWDISEVIQLP